MQHLKALQDETLPPEEHYIRYIAEIPLAGLPVHDEDDLEPAASTGKMLRIIVCMWPEGSRRLATAQFVQSDIAFKRVSGFLEFELGGLDHDANMGKYYTFCFHNSITESIHSRHLLPSIP